ncbi:HNH endonuclease [Rhodobacter sp. TJ_12]|uniref:HNH endonuclease n=1 Tax=Rhodobacter sp. TJ_12 TaxID=2029399 RepID=UPI001CC015BC
MTHHIAWILGNQRDLPKGKHVDHINGDRADKRTLVRQVPQPPAQHGDRLISCAARSHYRACGRISRVDKRRQSRNKAIPRMRPQRAASQEAGTRGADLAQCGPLQTPRPFNHSC